RCRADGSDVELVLSSDLNLGFEGPRAVARTLMKEGDTAFCALAWNGAPAPRTVDDAYKRLVWTAHHWQHWLARGTFPDHPWRSYLERSALTLKGLTYAPSGAVVAAPTTSLPETPRGERNWDYRYSWIRDSTFALWGLFTLGFDWEANDYLHFIADVAERDHDLQIMYGVDGERSLVESTLDHLSGYEGARPVRIGNAAYDQRQHDMWGAVLDSVYLHTKKRDHLEERIWPILERQVEAAIKHWREPDRGIWEVRGEPRHFLSSKVMCWVAADRGARLARLRDEPELAQRWQAAADEMHADICENGVDKRGVFTQHYDTDALDASALLMPLVRFLPPTDERIRRTVLAIADELTDDGLVLRYRPEETDDGLGGAEGTFTICSFWLVSALIEIGEVDRARRLCEKLLSYSSPLGLYGEELDPDTGRHLGNFPQAFTHLALINALMHVIGAEREELPQSATTLSPQMADGNGKMRRPVARPAHAER
ncbi:MAG TPA: glycoside hydrolase family 15 protein, partial [Candidatus Limnocylindria bacterium]|nr:glycoside hydrolase family 15 protein [Candidatus Limnocylindria bacterium]